MAVRIGRYEIIRAIASGGMATVHLARTLGEGGFERLVAIKVMHPHIATDPAFVAMFLDEARLAARIRHPNVVATHDVQKSPAGVFLVMDYIDGPSLQTILRALNDRDRAMPLPITLRIMSDALSGLHAAHELTGEKGEPLNLIHRDVSPDNVLVGTDGLARITDFGVARAESRISTTSGQFLKGKLAFMAPERIMHGQVDRRSDVYSAGATLWEALCGKRLFEADDNGMLLTKIVVGATSSPRAYNPDVPEAVEAVTMRSINRDPNARFPTAAAFADALEEAARASGILPATPRQVAAFLRDLKSEGVVATQRLPNGHALTLALAQATPSQGAAYRDAGAASSPSRGRWIAALAAGAFVVGLVVTILIVSSPVGGPKPATATDPSGGSPTAAPSLLAPTIVTVTPGAASSPAPVILAPSASPSVTAPAGGVPAPPGQAPFPPPGASSPLKRPPGAAGPGSTPGLAPSRKEFTPGGL